MYLSDLAFLLISSGNEFLFTKFFFSIMLSMPSAIKSLDREELERLLELSDLMDADDLIDIFDLVRASDLGEFDEAENCLFPKLSLVNVSSSFRRVSTLSSASR